MPFQVRFRNRDPAALELKARDLGPRTKPDFRETLEAAGNGQSVSGPMEVDPWPNTGKGSLRWQVRDPDSEAENWGEVEIDADGIIDVWLSNPPPWP